MRMPQRPMAAAVVATDLREDVRPSRLARLFRFAHVLVGKPVPTLGSMPEGGLFPGYALGSALLRALHAARQREGEGELSRHRHLICMDETHPDLDILRRPCRSAKNCG